MRLHSITAPSWLVMPLLALWAAVKPAHVLISPTCRNSAQGSISRRSVIGEGRKITECVDHCRAPFACLSLRLWCLAGHDPSLTLTFQHSTSIPVLPITLVTQRSTIIQSQHSHSNNINPSTCVTPSLPQPLLAQSQHNGEDPGAQARRMSARNSHFYDAFADGHH